MVYDSPVGQLKFLIEQRTTNPMRLGHHETIQPPSRGWSDLLILERRVHQTMRWRGPGLNGSLGMQQTRSRSSTTRGSSTTWLRRKRVSSLRANQTWLLILRQKYAHGFVVGMPPPYAKRMASGVRINTVAFADDRVAVLEDAECPWIHCRY
jgi:hypothetical protein